MRLEIAMEPLPYKRPGQSGRHRYDVENYRAFKEELGFRVKQLMKEPLMGAVSITLDFYRKRRPTTRYYGDIDNHVKAVFDALNGIAYTDDARIVELHARLHDGEPHITISLKEVAEPPKRRRKRRKK